MNRILVSFQEDMSENLLKKAENLADSKNTENFVESVLKKLQKDGEEISVFFCCDDFIREYNKNDRGIDSATDILEYENGEIYEDDDGKWRLAGDMLISLETLPKNALEFQTSENEELKRLLIHGTLHLLGMNHGDEHLEIGIEPKCEMLKLQERILAESADFKII